MRTKPARVSDPRTGAKWVWTAMGAYVIICLAMTAIVPLLAPKPSPTATSQADSAKSNPTFFARLEEVAKALALLLAAPAAVYGLHNYWRGLEQQADTQRQQQLSDTWRRKQYVAGAVETFQQQASVRIAMHVLDYTARRMPLFPNMPKYEDRFVRVDEQLAGVALIPHTFTERPAWGAPHVAIRDAFDDFFGRLDHFWVMIEAGLITAEDIKPYLKYWTELLVGSSSRADCHSASFWRIVHLYIDHYGFEGVKNLCKELGSGDVNSTADDKRVLVNEIKAGK